MHSLPSLLASSVGVFLPLLSCGGDGLTLPDDGQDRQVAVLVAVSGDEQSGTAGSRLSAPLVVEARARTGKPIADASISFSFKGDVGGGALDPGTVATGTDGRAAVEVTLGQTSGVQAVEASVAPGSSEGPVVRFLLTAVLPDEDEGGGGGGRNEPRGGGGGRGGDQDDDRDNGGNRGRGGGEGHDDDHHGGHGGHGGGGGDED